MRYVVESDLQSYFDTVNHEWLRKFVRHRVNDGGLIRLLDQWLKAGVMENGVVTHLDEGVPQGGPVSPVLSNVYLHYVLDLWFERRFKKTCRGFAELTRFADDYVATFQNQPTRSDFGAKWKSDSQPSGYGSPRKRQQCCALTEACCKGAGSRLTNQRPSLSLASSTT